MVTITAYLMIGHWAVLPHPETNDSDWQVRLTAAPSVDHKQWTAIHFLYDNCACSRRVLEHVLVSSPIEGVTERIVLISDNPQEFKREGRFIEVEYVTPARLKERYGVESAPLLVVMDGQQNVRYSAGYTARKQGPEIKDREIISRLLKGDEVTELPLYGCAVSAEMKKLIDPLGLKN